MAKAAMTTTIDGYTKLIPPLSVSLNSIVSILVPDKTEGKRKTIVMKEAPRDEKGLVQSLINERNVLRYLKSLPSHAEFIELVSLDHGEADHGAVPASVTPVTTSEWGRDGVIYLEYPQGYKDLTTQVIDWEELLDWDEVKQEFTTMYKVAKKSMDALNRLHDLGIYHRDIKPDNLLIHPGTGDIKWLDFGSAYRTPPPSASDASPKVAAIDPVTNGGNPNALGTVCYCAPECFIAPLTDPSKQDQKQVIEFLRQSDIWSMGITLLAMMCGYNLFQCVTFRRALKHYATWSELPGNGEGTNVWKYALTLVFDWCRNNAVDTESVADSVRIPVRMMLERSDRANKRREVCPELHETLVVAIESMLILDPSRRTMPSLPSPPSFEQ